MQRTLFSLALAAAFAVPVVAQNAEDDPSGVASGSDYNWSIDNDDQISGRGSGAGYSGGVYGGNRAYDDAGVDGGGSNYRLPDRAEAAAELQVISQQERRSWNLAGDQYQEARQRAQERARESTGYDQTLQQAADTRNSYRERRQRVLDQLEDNNSQYAQLIKEEEQMQSRINRLRREGQQRQAQQMATQLLEKQNRIDRMEDQALEDDQQYQQLEQQMTSTRDELDRAERRVERGVRTGTSGARKRAFAARSRWEDARAEAYGAAQEYAVAEDAELQEDRLRFNIAEESYRGYDDDLDIDWDD